MLIRLLIGCSGGTLHIPDPPPDTVDTAAPDTDRPDTDLPVDTDDTDLPRLGLRTDKPSYVVGERVFVTFDDAVGSEADWIGLYPASQTENENSWAWLYTTGTQEPGLVGPIGEVRFLPISLPSGSWEARLFHDDGYDLTDRVAFEVVEPGDIACPAPSGDLTVMTFNSWLDGSAVEDGLDQIAAAVVACDPDLVAFQEGGHPFARDIAAALADLDPTWEDADVEDDGSDNVIVSRLPILDHDRVTGALLVTVSTADGPIAVVGSHFDYTVYGPYLARDGQEPDRIEESEVRVRGDDADRVIELLDGLGSALVLGDHNAPSHLDWTDANADQNFDLLVDWPTSLAFTDAGFVDGYRTVHPDPVADRGLTWTSGYPKGEFDPSEVHDRIDFVYSRDGELVLTPLAATVYSADPWPSDHRAVVVSYAMQPR